MPIRRNILRNPAAGREFVRGVKLLKREVLAPSGRSTYDLFVVWHHRAMMRLTPPTQSSRNAAHSGPAFFPWHRFMLALFEREMQRVLQNPNFALPYWKWEADGDLPPSQQTSGAIWSVLGGDGSPVNSGPFAPQEWRVRVEVNPNSGQLVTVNRGLNRDFAASAPSLPSRVQARAAVSLTTYDTGPWNSASVASFRNRLEGWESGPQLHNRVHVWIGGDMLASTSPNDPAFYLNHCNADRLWAAWQRRHGAGRYAPAPTDPSGPIGHRRNDRLFPMTGTSGPRISDTFATLPAYEYDSLAV